MAIVLLYTRFGSDSRLTTHKQLAMSLPRNQLEPLTNAEKPCSGHLLFF